jgi:hypothetical protein
LTQRRASIRVAPTIPGAGTLAVIVDDSADFVDAVRPGGTTIS